MENLFTPATIMRLQVMQIQNADVVCKVDDICHTLRHKHT